LLCTRTSSFVFFRPLSLAECPAGPKFACFQLRHRSSPIFPVSDCPFNFLLFSPFFFFLGVKEQFKPFPPFPFLPSRSIIYRSRLWFNLTQSYLCFSPHYTPSPLAPRPLFFVSCIHHVYDAPAKLPAFRENPGVIPATPPLVLYLKPPFSFFLPWHGLVVAVPPRFVRI